jgi:hypothetical protein
MTCCCDPHRLNNTFMFLGSLTHLNLTIFAVFSTCGVIDVQNFNMCDLDFCVVPVVWSGLVWSGLSTEKNSAKTDRQTEINIRISG